jgi:flavin reductase (DIM6/NTAB) family NADH-FMN oxidoreductase RutF
MQIDYAELTQRERYKLLVACIVPRPIALVSTWSPGNVPNAAPFSFFNAVCDDPPAIAVGVNGLRPGHHKDTARNIRKRGDFVVNLVDEAIAPQMNVCAVDFEPGVSEFAVSGFTPVPATKVQAPRVAESPIAFECRRLQIVELAPGRNLIIGEVVCLHIRDDLLDREKLHVRTQDAKLIGRAHGTGWYVRTSDMFDMPRRKAEEFPGVR